MATSRLCSIPDCGKPVACRGWCGAHYIRWQRHGDPLAGRTPQGEPQRYYLETVLPYDGDECLTWPYATTAGYGVLWKNGHNNLVSRLVCEATNGPPPTPYHEAAHVCGRGGQGCVTKKHLFWKTHAGNMADMIEHSTSRRGEINPQAVLTEANVRDIRALKGTMLQREIAELFGVSPPLINAIHRKKRWAWLD